MGALVLLPLVLAAPDDIILALSDCVNAVMLRDPRSFGPSRPAEDILDMRCRVVRLVG